MSRRAAHKSLTRCGPALTDACRCAMVTRLSPWQGGTMSALRSLVSFSLLTVLSVVPGIAAAQTGAGALTGIISDQSGAKVPGATVTATNQATNVAYTAVSNEAGNYTITSVPVGAYVVKAELSGFKTVTTDPISVEAKAIVRMDFSLALGAIEETILV